MRGRSSGRPRSIEESMKTFNAIHVLIKNTLSLLFSGAISVVFSYLTLIYLARVLGAGDFGKLNFALAIAIYFTIIADMGLPLFGARTIARQRSKVKAHMDKIISLRLCLAVVSFILLLLAALLLNQPREVKYLIILYGLGMVPAALLLEWVFQGIEKMEYIGLSRILSRASVFFLVFAFVKGPDQLLLVPCLQFLGNSIAVALLLVVLWRKYGLPQFNLDLSRARKILSAAAPLGAAALMIHVIYNIDTIMLGLMRSDEEVGYYSAACRIIVLLFAPGLAFFDSSFPIISRYYKSSLNSLRQLQYHTVKLVSILAVPLAIGGVLLAAPIIAFLYGKNYQPSAIVLQILIWCVVFWGVNHVYARGLIACDRQNRFLAILVIQVITNLVLNFLLIPSYGVCGAAFATLAAELGGLILYVREFNKIARVPLPGHLLKPLLASLPMAFFLYWGLAKINLLFLIVGGAAIFLVCLVSIKGVSRQETAMLRDYMHR